MSPTYDSSLALHAADLSCRRGGRMVFEGVSFDVQSGDFLLLSGRNGAGKSTLLRLLAGLLPAAGGEVSLSQPGETVSGLPSEKLMLVGHQHGLKPGLTLRDNAVFFHRLMTGTLPTEEGLLAAAEKFGLAALLDEPVQYFSSGQRHRSSLMRYALVPRQIWLMDEPTVGLDSANRDALSLLIKEHLAAGGIAIAASHDPIDVEGRSLNMDGCAPKSAQFEEAWL